jgi:DNA helicase-2/ATP-dependent DNA helicase PcrA
VVIQALDLDIEVDANESRPGGGRAFEAFFDALEGFQALGQGASLRAFLGWLREAETRDRLTPRSDPPEEGCVQIVTIHGAKGLEWDLVAVPRLVTDELPRGKRDAQGWVAFGQLPYEFRGDKGSLPVFVWRGAETRKQLLERHAQFKESVYAEQLLEDRRLAYVAITRARRRLLLSGSFWSTQVGARAPSEYLRELAEDGVIDPVPEDVPAGPNPTIAEPELVPWPRDPLGGRRERVTRAAELVRAASPEPTGRWSTEATLLLAERERAAAGPVRPPAPTRIPASRFSEFVWSRDEVADRLLRPMPEKPYRATRLGTQFHSWVENRPAQADELLAYSDGFDSDALPTELDGDLVDADERKLAQLRANFERSEWAGRIPVEIEREVHLPFDGRIAICKIDAVYELPPGADGLPRFEIVDWKTGKPPSGPKDVERKSLQLALYKLAYSKWARVEPERIEAAFYFVADDLVIRPPAIADEAALLVLWRTAFGDRSER